MANALACILFASNKKRANGGQSKTNEWGNQQIFPFEDF